MLKTKQINSGISSQKTDVSNCTLNDTYSFTKFVLLLALVSWLKCGLHSFTELPPEHMRGKSLRGFAPSTETRYDAPTIVYGSDFSSTLTGISFFLHRKRAGSTWEWHPCKTSVSYRIRMRLGPGSLFL